MKKVTFHILSLTLVSLMISCNTNSNQSAEKENAATAKTEVTTDNSGKALENNNLEIIQFHSTNRCMTCKKIEKLTKETLRDYEKVDFKLVNVDEKENKAMAKKYQASGTALFLHNTKTDGFTNLTEFAFMKAGNNDAFKKELKGKMSQF